LTFTYLQLIILFQRLWYISININQEVVMKRLLILSLVCIFLNVTISTVSAQEWEEWDMKAALVLESGVLAEKGGILIGKGKFIFDPELAYTHTSTNKLDITGFTILPTIIIGLIQVERIKRDILNPSVTFKYGILENLEFDLKVPYIIRTDKYAFGVSPDTQSRTVQSSNIGDVEGVFLYQLMNERGSRPDIVANLKIKTITGKDPYDLPTETILGNTITTTLPTGSGNWALEPGFTFVKTSDPAIFFANISYFWHIEKDIGGAIGKVDPGDSFNYSLGLAYALSERLVLSTTFDQKFFTRTKINGIKQDETDINISQLSFGTSFAFHEKRSLSLTVGIGLTPNSPDVQIAIKMPIKVL
jgi:hypothetical protein